MTLRLPSSTSLAGREMLSVEHLLCYPQSVPPGTWHCQVGQTHPLVSGWETNSGGWLDVSKWSSLTLGYILDMLCIVQGEIWQATGCSTLCNQTSCTKSFHLLLCSCLVDLLTFPYLSTVMDFSEIRFRKLLIWIFQAVCQFAMEASWLDEWLCWHYLPASTQSQQANIVTICALSDSNFLHSHFLGSYWKGSE